MNEIVYNILRKCVESLEKFNYRLSMGKHWNFHYIYLTGNKVAEFLECKRIGSIQPHDMKFKLTDKECRRIIRGMEYVEAMKIRRLVRDKHFNAERG